MDGGMMCWVWYAWRLEGGERNPEMDEGEVYSSYSYRRGVGAVDGL